MSAVLTVEDLSIRIQNMALVEGVSFSLKPGRVSGLIGASGSGKSLTAYALAGLLPPTFRIGGRVMLDGENLIDLRETELAKKRGSQISVVFQEPMTALNPLQTIEQQVGEVYRIHRNLDRKQAALKAKSVLERVGLEQSKVPSSRYPHELSGGQRQRVVIAMAIAVEPRVLIADEPTTALDVSSQSAVLGLVKSLCAEDNIAVLLISHDRAIVAEMADDITVINDGKITQPNITAAEYFRNLIPHSAGTAPGDAIAAPLESENLGSPLLGIRDLVCRYPRRRRNFVDKAQHTTALRSVSFQVQPGRSLGVVGESGSGKSTMARALMGLQPIASGHITYRGDTIDYQCADDLRRLRQMMQMVFQDPYSSFNPKMRVADIIAEPLHLVIRNLSRNEKRDKAAEAILSVGLKEEHLDRLPSAFSGGQRQRIAIARALCIEPELIILDEATSALDDDAETQILELLRHLRATRGLNFIFISHDLGVIRQIADDIIVLKDGSIVEAGPTRAILNAPQHTYTKQLADAALSLGRKLEEFQSAAESHQGS